MQVCKLVCMPDLLCKRWSFSALLFRVVVSCCRACTILLKCNDVLSPTGVQTVYFFAYNGLICWALFLMLGTIGWRASLLFVRHIYKVCLRLRTT